MTNRSGIVSEYESIGCGMRVFMYIYSFKCTWCAVSSTAAVPVSCCFEHFGTPRNMAPVAQTMGAVSMWSNSAYQQCLAASHLAREAESSKHSTNDIIWYDMIWQYLAIWKQYENNMKAIWKQYETELSIILGDQEFQQNMYLPTCSSGPARPETCPSCHTAQRSVQKQKDGQWVQCESLRIRNLQTSCVLKGSTLGGLEPKMPWGMFKGKTFWVNHNNSLYNLKLGHFGVFIHC